MAKLQIEYFSSALIRPVMFRMFLPNDPRGQAPTTCEGLKTLLMLHGYTGSADYWGCEALAEKYGFAMVMPSGENAFYLDGLSTGHKFATFVGEELITYLRSTFSLAKSAEDTYVLGISMGGFGAIHTALAYPDSFGKAGLLSAALIVNSIAGMKPGFEDGTANYEYYRECFGDLDKVKESDANPETLALRLLAQGKKLPEVYQCIGTEDFLLERNREFHRFMAENGIAHTYKESKGAHEGAFWDEYLPKVISWMFDEDKDQ